VVIAIGFFRFRPLVQIFTDCLHGQQLGKNIRSFSTLETSLHPLVLPTCENAGSNSTGGDSIYFFSTL